MYLQIVSLSVCLCIFVSHVCEATVRVLIAAAAAAVIVIAFVQHLNV